MPGFVQGNTQFQSALSPTIGAAFANPVVAGNLLVVAVSWRATNGTPTVTDLQGNSYGIASDLVVQTGLGFSSQLFWTIAGSSGANAVTVTWNTDEAFGRLQIHEYNGWNSFDAGHSDVGDGTTAPMSGFPQAYDGSNYQMAAGDLLFASGLSNDGTTTAGTNFTLRETAGSESTEDRVLPSAGAYQADYFHDGSAWLVSAASFTAATPRRIQVATNGGVTSSLTVTLSSTPVPGHLLVAFADSDATISMASAGWTLQSSSVVDNASYMWTKVAGGSEPTTVTFTPAVNDNIVALVAEYSGVASATPDIALSSSANSTASVTVAPAGFTTTHEHDMIIAFAGLGSGGAGGARPSAPGWAGGLLNITSVSDGASWSTVTAQHAFYGERLSVPRGTTTVNLGYTGSAQHRGQIVAAFVPATVGGAQTVLVTGVASAETVGTATQLNLTSHAVAITTAEAEGTPTVTIHGGAVVPTSIDGSVGGYGTGGYGTDGYGTGVNTGTPTVTSVATATPTGIGSGEAEGVPTVTTGPVTITPIAIITGETEGAPTVTSKATVSPAGIGSGEAEGTSTVLTSYTILPSGIGSGEAVSAVSGVLTHVGIIDIGIPSGESFGTPAIGMTVYPPGVAGGETVGSPAVTTAIALLIAGIASGETFDAIAIQVSAVTVYPTGISSKELLGVLRIGYAALGAKSPTSVAILNQFVSVQVALYAATVQVLSSE